MHKPKRFGDGKRFLHVPVIGQNVPRVVQAGRVGVQMKLVKARALFDPFAVKRLVEKGVFMEGGNQ